MSSLQTNVFASLPIAAFLAISACAGSSPTSTEQSTASTTTESTNEEQASDARRREDSEGITRCPHGIDFSPASRAQAASNWETVSQHWAPSSSLSPDVLLLKLQAYLEACQLEKPGDSDIPDQGGVLAAGDTSVLHVGASVLAATRQDDAWTLRLLEYVRNDGPMYEERISDVSVEDSPLPDERLIDYTFSVSSSGYTTIEFDDEVQSACCVGDYLQQRRLARVSKDGQLLARARLGGISHHYNPLDESSDTFVRCAAIVHADMEGLSAVTNTERGILTGEDGTIPELLRRGAQATSADLTLPSEYRPRGKATTAKHVITWDQLDGANLCPAFDRLD